MPGVGFPSSVHRSMRMSTTPPPPGGCRSLADGRPFLQYHVRGNEGEDQLDLADQPADKCCVAPRSWQVPSTPSPGR